MDEIIIEIDNNVEQVESSNNISIIDNNNIPVNIIEHEYEITVQKHEYVVTGDDMYIPLSYDDSPQWLKDTINNITDFSLNQKLTELNLLTTSLNGLIAELEVAKNTYTQSIISSADIDDRINSRIETLNSSIAESDATIADLISTKATPTESTTLALNVLTASINDGAISSLVSNLQNAISTSTSTLSNNIDIVHAEMTGEFNANAEVIDSMQAYVGIDEAGASTGTGLSAYLEGSNGVIGSVDSKVANNVYVDDNGISRSKFEYNSNVNVGGVNYASGFGLATSVNSPGNGIVAGDSQFWINASKFKFTNTNKTGSVSPFTIDASGSQPQITFNGKVTFGSGQTGTIDQAIAAVVETVAVGDKNINITDNLIPTTSLVADTDNSGYQFVGTPTKSMSAGLESFSESQIVLDTGDEVYSPYVDEVTIPYYYRFGIKGITNLDRFKIVTIDSSNVVLYNDITVTMEVSQSLSAVNWYTVDGVINPTGGTTTADGDIRDINGVKVGSINNFVIPSGTTKVLLGWIADCTISRMKMCKITADTITSDFSSVNGQLADLNNQVSNIGWNSLSGKDVLAQKFGYTTYSALESAATAGETVVVGGKINTELIEVNAINANQINTTGLIAENISANEIVGKTLTGTVINGAAINGAVIKASYLDLDGELEVLTNYHITPAMYNANPSLYSDAVYLSGTNEYRIPSLSTIRESTLSQAITTPTTIYGAMCSYNTANVGNNLKAVKIRPTFNNQVSFELFRSVSSDTWFAESFTYGRKNHFKLSLGTTTLIECTLDLSDSGSYSNGNDDTTIVTVSGQGFATFVNQFYSYGGSCNQTYNLDIGIGILSLNIICYGNGGAGENPAPNQVTIIGTLTTGSQLLPFNWTSGRLKFEQIVAPSKPWYGSTSEYTAFSLNQSMYINNMI